MHFVVEVPDAIASKIEGWCLPRDVEDQLLVALHEELSTCREDEFLRVIKAPVRLAITTVLLETPTGVFPLRFTVWVDCWKRPGTRVVFDIAREMLVDDDP